ncbi:hypothetical protein ACSSS7_003981 [Eimeria intestinalis]
MPGDGGEAFASEGEARTDGKPAPDSYDNNCSFLPAHLGTWEAASCGLTSAFAFPQRAFKVADESSAEAKEAPVETTVARGERSESVLGTYEEVSSPAQRLPSREDMLKMAHALGLSQTKASDFAFVAAEAQDGQRLKPEDAEHSGFEGFSKLWSEGSEEGQIRSPGQQQFRREDKLEQQPQQDYHPEKAALADGGLTPEESLTAEPGELFDFSSEKRGLGEAESGLPKSSAAASSGLSTPTPQNNALHVVDFAHRVEKPYGFCTPPGGSFSVLRDPPWGEEGELLTPMEAAQQAAYFASVAEMAAQRVADLDEGEEPPERLLASKWEEGAATPSPFSNSQSGQKFTSAQLLLTGSRGADRERTPAALDGEILTPPSGWLAFSGAGGDRMSAIEAARYFSTRAIHTAGLAVAHCMQSFQIREGASPLPLPSQLATAQLQQVHPLPQQLQNLAANTAALQLKRGEDPPLETSHAADRLASRSQATTAFPGISSRVSASSSSAAITGSKDSRGAQSAGEEQQQLQQQEAQQWQQQKHEASQLEEQREKLHEQHVLLQKLEAELAQQKTRVQQETQQLLQQQQKTQRQLEALGQREEDISRQREQLEMQREVQSRLQQELQLRDLQQRQQGMLQQQQQQQQQLQNQHQRQQLHKEELLLQMRQQLLEQQLLSHQQVVADFERRANTQLLQRDALQQQLHRQLEDLKVKEELLRHQQKEQAAREQELQQQQDEQKAKERRLQLQQGELQAKDRQLQRQQEEQEAREQDLQRRQQQQQDKETELQRLEKDQREKQEQLQQQQQQLSEQQQQQNQKVQEWEQQMQQRDANGAAAQADGSAPLFTFLNEPATKDEATLHELQHIERQLLALCLAYLNQRKRHLVLLRKPLEAQGQLLRWASSKPAAAAGNAAAAMSPTGLSAGIASSIPDEQRDMCVRLALPLLTKRAEYLGGQGLVQGESSFRFLGGSNKAASAHANWPSGASQAYPGTAADPTTQTPPSHASGGQGITSGLGGGPIASTPQQSSGERDAPPSATFGSATKSSNSCSAVRPSAPRQQQSFNAGLTPGGAPDVGNAASVTTDEEGLPGRMLSSASEAFRRLPSGFQGGDLTLLGFTEGQAPPPPASSKFSAKGITPSFFPTSSQLSQGSIDATASEWLMRRLQQQSLQHLQQPHLQRQQLAFSKRLEYGSGRAASRGSAALAVMSGASVGLPGPLDS